MLRTQRQINKALQDVEKIQSFLHPLGDPDPKQNLFQSLARREDAVRVTVLQMSLAIEDLLDCLFWRVYKNRPTKRLLEYEGRNFFELKVLEEFMEVYSAIYLKLFDRYLS